MGISGLDPETRARAVLQKHSIARPVRGYCPSRDQDSTRTSFLHLFRLFTRHRQESQEAAREKVEQQRRPALSFNLTMQDVQGVSSSGGTAVYCCCDVLYLVLLIVEMEATRTPFSLHGKRRYVITAGVLTRRWETYFPAPCHRIRPYCYFLPGVRTSQYDTLSALRIQLSTCDSHRPHRRGGSN